MKDRPKPDVMDLINVTNFLFWYEQEDPKATWGEIKIGDAIESLRKILGYDEDAFELLERIALGEVRAEDLSPPKTPEPPSAPSQTPTQE